MSVLALRTGVARLSTSAGVDMDRVLTRASSPSEVAQALGDLLPALVREYGAAASTLAAQWYDEERRRREIRGKFTPRPANLGTSGADALAGYGAQAVARHGGVVPAVRTLVVGGLQRRISNYARQTIITSSLADPRARGWQRVGDGSSCEFCSMLLDRGAVYTEASAEFSSHDHCGCSAEPAWG